jgi:pimeloyl-ACP methyl ester carboxylesterase
MQHLVLEGRRIEYRDRSAAVGGRPVLVLLHEGLGSASMWGKFPERLAAATGCRVIVPSRAGYGHSDPYPEPRTARYQHREGEEALPAFLAALGIPHPVIIGHSDGGTMALLFAAAHPDAPLGIALMAPHEFIEEETLAGIRAAGEAWRTTEWPARLARHHADAPRVFQEWHDTWLSPEYRHWNIEDRLPFITCPVLAIQGVDDEYASLRQIEVIADQVPGTRLLALANCGHSPHRDQEAAVLSALTEFINTLAAPVSPTIRE